MIIRKSTAAFVLAAAVFVAADARAQLFTISRERLIQLTAKNPFDRFPDGRPKVPDSILEKVRGLSSEEINLGRRGYPNQYVDGWQILRPGKTMAGRAFTLQFMPIRADVVDAINAERRAQGGDKVRPLMNQTAIDQLGPGDVLVVELYGCGERCGGVIGDNLTYYIMKTTGVGFVIDGAIRDLQGVAPMEVLGYYRSAVPPAIRDVMVTGINIPVRIGNATVMPGDVVFGDREGVTFIPPEFVQEVVDAAEITHIHDEWTKLKFDEKKYVSSDIYGSPREPALIKEYEAFLKGKLGQARYDEYKKRQQERRPPQGRPQQ